MEVNIKPLTFNIDLSKVIAEALLQRNPGILQLLLDNSVDFYQVEPKSLIMCLETEHWGLMGELIKRKFPIDVENYRVLYQLATVGQLDLLILIVKIHQPNTDSIGNEDDDSHPDNGITHSMICKICANAIIHGQLSVLKYFFPSNMFASAPDFRYAFIDKAIEFGGYLEIVKYLIANDFNIAQEKYKLVHTAIKFGRVDIIKYFYELDSNIIGLFTADEQIKYGLIELTKKHRYIGTQTSCNIYYNDISIGDEYYMCNNEKHHYSREAWDRWVIKKPEWKCPHCFCEVPRVVYVNKN